MVALGMSEVMPEIVQVLPDRLPGETEAVKPEFTVTVKVAVPPEVMPDLLIGVTEPPVALDGLLTIFTVTVYVGVCEKLMLAG